MLNKFLIPAALVATVIIAGVFAFMPVEKASTVHGTLSTATGLTSATTGSDRMVSFSINQSYVSAVSSSGITIIPTQTGVTYTGNYMLNAVPNNSTAAGLSTNHGSFECGLTDGTSLVSATNATGGSPSSGTLDNLGSGDGIRIQIDTATFDAATSYGGVCEGIIFLDSDDG